MNKLATISQIQISDQIYEICDANNRQTTETINNTLTTINQNLAAIQSRFDSNGILKIANGGTAKGDAPSESITNQNALLRALGVAKTAGDTIEITGFRGAGYITTGRKDFSFSICTRFFFYGANAKNSFITGTYTIRQADDYHFGSTGSAGYSFTNHHTIAHLLSSGIVNVTINTGAEQTRAVNNDAAGIVINSGTLNLRS